MRLGGALAPERAAAVVGAVAAGLDAIHAAGLVHRDVKPANVLLDEAGHVWVGDFGLARPVDGGTGPTDPGAWVGTAGFAAPEQIRGEAVDARTDVYALGCVLFFTLTGPLPVRPRVGQRDACGRTSPTRRPGCRRASRRSTPSSPARCPRIRPTASPPRASSAPRSARPRAVAGRGRGPSSRPAAPPPRRGRRRRGLAAGAAAALLAAGAATFLAVDGRRRGAGRDADPDADARRPRPTPDRHDHRRGRRHAATRHRPRRRRRLGGEPVERPLDAHRRGATRACTARRPRRQQGHRHHGGGRPPVGDEPWHQRAPAGGCRQRGARAAGAPSTGRSRWRRTAAGCGWRAGRSGSTSARRTSPTCCGGSTVAGSRSASRSRSTAASARSPSAAASSGSRSGTRERSCS